MKPVIPPLVGSKDVIHLMQYMCTYSYNCFHYVIVLTQVSRYLGVNSIGISDYEYFEERMFSFEGCRSAQCEEARSVCS